MSEPREPYRPPVPYAPYGPAHPPPPLPGQPAPRRPSHPLDVVVTVVQLVLLAAAALLATFGGLFVVAEAGGCAGETRCSGGLVAGGVFLAVAAPGICFVIATTWAVVRMVQRRLAFWVPPLAVLAWVGLVAVAVGLVRSAVGR